ncbi:MAG: glycosyltransferase [Candidatus Lokiarchaeota archaeon]|nr:glycosyltransferase [Candidatus Lokiarchaeota archaeon]
MNILIVTDDFYPNRGGIAHTMCNLYTFLKNEDDKVFVINPNMQSGTILKLMNSRVDNLKKISLRFISKVKNYFFLFYILFSILFYKKVKISHRLSFLIYFFYRFKISMNIIDNIRLMYPVLKKNKFDLILVSHGGWIFPLGFILKIILKKKLVLMVHGNDFLVKNPISQKTNFFLNTDKIIVSNSIMKNLIKKIHHLEDKQLKIIHRALNISQLYVDQNKRELRDLYDIPKNEFIILSVGRHVERKNFDLVIKCIKEIYDEESSINIHYYLIGEGKETEKLKLLTIDLKIEKNVTFLGECSENKRNHFYKLSDLFIMTPKLKKNSIEGFGIVFIEANYYKLPCIGSDHYGVRSAIIDGKSGFLIEPNNLSQLKEKIMELYRDESLRERIGEFGYERVVRAYTWDKVVHDYIETFINLSRL